MANKWFRMYADFLDDPKVISLAFEDQRHFVGILALKCVGIIDQQCRPEIKDRMIAQRLWIDHGTIRDVKRRLVDAGLIDQAWQPIAWDRRQFVSDHDPTSRERKQKQRIREKEMNVTRDVTDKSRTSHTKVTRTDTDTDTDTDQNSSVVSSSSQESIPVDETQLCHRASRSTVYSDDFEEFWTQYPKRHGADSKQAGWRCWQSRIKDGCGPGTMILGAQRYAAYCDAKAITGTEYVMQASRFLGRDRHFENDWRKPNASGYVFDPNDRPF